jgi:hypothetical protein
MMMHGTMNVMNVKMKLFVDKPTPIM